MNLRLHIFVSFFTLASLPGFAQQDSLTLFVSSEYKPEDSAKSYFIRMDIRSNQSKPVTLPARPFFPARCCETKGPIGFEIQQLLGNCFVQLQNCADCDLVRLPKDPNGVLDSDETQVLKQGESFILREDLSRAFVKGAGTGVKTGYVNVYRVKGWINYPIGNDKYRRIESDWFYIRFPPRLKAR